MPTKPNLLDSVILLSGVNYSSVAKVVAALKAVSDKEGLPAPTWMHPDSMPARPYSPDDPADATRGESTAAYVRALLDEGYADQHHALDAPSLRFHRRQV